MERVLDRIAERRALLAEQAERLRKELSEVEAELERVSSAEQVVAQLLAEPDTEQDGESGGQAGEGAASGSASGSGRRTPAPVVPHRAQAAGVEDLPADYQQMMRVVAEEGPVACKRVTVKLGLTTEPRHTEGVRVKLKRLVARGWLTEVAPGRFARRP